MIRYATSDDAEWIVGLQEANPEVVRYVLRDEALSGEIEARNILIEDDDEDGTRHSFVHYRVGEEATVGYLILTDEPYRRQGHARLLLQYLYTHYNKPIHYAVEANSASEDVWVKRSAKARAGNVLLRTISSEGRKFRAYESVYPPHSNEDNNG